MKLFATVAKRFLAIERLLGSHWCVAAMVALALVRSLASVLAVNALGDLFSAIETGAYTAQSAALVLLWLAALEILRTGALWLRMRIASGESGRLHRKLLRRCIASGVENDMPDSERATVAAKDVRRVAEDGFAALEGSCTWLISIAVYIVYGLIVNPAATAVLTAIELGVICSIQRLNSQLDAQNEARRAA